MASKRANGEGSVYRVEGGRWRAALSYVDPATGASKRATFTGSTRKAALDRMNEAVDRLGRGGPVRDASATMAAYSAAWRASTLPASARKPTTRTTYDALARCHIEPAPFGSIRLDRLRPSDVEALVLRLRGKGLAESTVRQVYTVCRAILDAARRDGLVARNVAAVVKRPSVRRVETRSLAPVDVRRLVGAAADSRYHAVLALLAETGMRRGEALALKWTDVDLDVGLLHVRATLGRVGRELVSSEPKSARSRRSLPLSSSAVATLRRQRTAQTEDRLRLGRGWPDTGHVFTTETGDPVDGGSVLWVTKQAARAAGLPDWVTVHTLRHSAATAMIEAGIPARTVSDALGHYSAAFTLDTYTHPSEDGARRAADALSAALGLG